MVDGGKEVSFYFHHFWFAQFCPDVVEKVLPTLDKPYVFKDKFFTSLTRRTRVARPTRVCVAKFDNMSMVLYV